jgi:hypothetical protein
MQCVSSIVRDGCSNDGHPVHAMLERKGEHELAAELASLYLTRKWCRYCLRTGNCGHDQRDAL